MIKAKGYSAVVSYTQFHLEPQFMDDCYASIRLYCPTGADGVQSVAYGTEMKEVRETLFFLLSIFCFYDLYVVRIL